MAPNGHAVMSDPSLLSGVKRKSDFGAVRAAFDPHRKSPLPMNLRCHVAKYWGRKTYIALNRSAVRADGITSGRLGQHFMPGRAS
jgi:hypothetical protein